MNDKAHCILKATPLKLGEVAVLANRKDPTQKDEKNEEIEECTLKERT